MWSSLDLFRDILPCCEVCKSSFDSRVHSPQALPCGHTFCLKCLEQDKKKKKRKCPCCSQKFKSFTVNHTFADAIERVAKRKVWADEHTKRCDECDVRHSLSDLRRCHTCEFGINQHIAVGFIECLVCFKCCVDRHNGHDLNAKLLERKSVTLETPVLPKAFSTPKAVQHPSSCEKPSLPTTPVPVPPNRSPSVKRHSPKKDKNKNEVVYESSPLYVTTSSSSPKRRRNWSSRLATLAKKRWSYTSDEIGDGDSRSSGVVSDEYRSDPESFRCRRIVKTRHVSDSVAPKKQPNPQDTVRSCCTDPNMSYAYIAP